MTSFATHRLRVHDTARPPYRRLSALRTCLTEFHAAERLVEVMPGVMRGRLSLEDHQGRDGVCPVCAADAQEDRRRA